jgi:pimeloyl-ACP methyl ester carboxylesterase
MSTAGLVQGRFPYVRFGTGPEPLVLLAGMVLDNPVPGSTSARAYAWSLHRLAVGRTVTVLWRPRGIGGLPAHEPEERDERDGPGTAELADAYASVIRDEFGPADVMALSTGGLIAQHLALHHPELVRRLVLVVTGARIADAGRQRCRAWLASSRGEDWRSLRGDLAAAAVDGAVATWLARLLVGSGRDPDAQDVVDFRATVSAVLRHDTTDALGGITAPTLVLGGRDDPFFPEPVLRATAAGIPGALVEVHAGGHGVPKQHGRWLQDRATTFLS